MRAQISLELLLDFLIVLALAGIALAVLQTWAGEAEALVARYAVLQQMEDDARMLDILSIRFPHGYAELNSSYRIDRGRLLQRLGNEWLAVKTWYGVQDAREPV